MIDRVVAARVADALGGGPGDPGAPAPGLAELALEAEAAVVAYTGLVPGRPLPVPEAIDRVAWRTAAIGSMDGLLTPLDDALGKAPWPLRAGAGALTGAEVGALVGYLGRRVLGQYDPGLMQPDAEPRLLLVSPNLAEAARDLGASAERVTAWVCVHEVTHAVQFTAAGWLQGHLEGLLRETLSGFDVSLDFSALLRVPAPEDLRKLGRALRDTGLGALTGSDTMEVLDRVQATMALVEGHAEHVMDAAAGGLVEDIDALRAALDRRRVSRSPLLALLDRVLGMDRKLRQYTDGKAFCDAVVASAGPAALRPAFAEPDGLPTPAELTDPAGWLARVA